MDASRFDRISKLLAQRRSRYETSQESTPAAPDDAERLPAPEFLFVQTFRSGAVAPKAAAEGRYTLSLEGGHGQTFYFSDRPNRVVGMHATPDFIDRFGFSEDDPPNAALVVETAPGERDVAVLELFSPVYDEATRGVTYEVEVLENWEEELGVGLGEAPSDLAALAPSFGTAHLFIDGLWDCPNGDIICTVDGQAVGTIPGSWFDNFCSSYFYGDTIVDRDGTRKAVQWLYCLPCTTPAERRGDGWGLTKPVWAYWGAQCNEQFAACNGNCRPEGWCKPDPSYPHPCHEY